MKTLKLSKFAEFNFRDSLISEKKWGMIFAIMLESIKKVFMKLKLIPFKEFNPRDLQPRKFLPLMQYIAIENILYDIP